MAISKPKRCIPFAREQNSKNLLQSDISPSNEIKENKPDDVKKTETIKPVEVKKAEIIKPVETKKSKDEPPKIIPEKKVEKKIETVEIKIEKPKEEPKKADFTKGIEKVNAKIKKASEIIDLMYDEVFSKIPTFSYDIFEVKKEYGLFVKKLITLLNPLVYGEETVEYGLDKVPVCFKMAGAVDISKGSSTFMYLLNAVEDICKPFESGDKKTSDYINAVINFAKERKIKI